MLCPILAFVDMVCAFPDSCRYHVQGVAEWCVYLSVCVCVCAEGWTRWRNRKSESWLCSLSPPCGPSACSFAHEAGAIRSLVTNQSLVTDQGSVLFQPGDGRKKLTWQARLRDKNRVSHSPGDLAKLVSVRVCAAPVLCLQPGPLGGRLRASWASARLCRAQAQGWQGS